MHIGLTFAHFRLSGKDPVFNNLILHLHILIYNSYSCGYSVCYQQTVFKLSLCGCIFLLVLFVTVFVLCHGTKKMLIVISGFACVYKCIFFIIIFNFSSFFREKRGKVCSAPLSLAEKLICKILASKSAPSLVCHGLIRTLLSLALSLAFQFWIFSLLPL